MLSLNFTLHSNKGIISPNKSNKNELKRSVLRKRGFETPKSSNFRSNRYYKPVRKMKSSSRIQSQKRPQEGVNSRIKINMSKNYQRYGSVLKVSVNN